MAVPLQDQLLIDYEQMQYSISNSVGAHWAKTPSNVLHPGMIRLILSEACIIPAGAMARRSWPGR
ncbi:MAG: hypothetical protein WCF81_21690 [Roseiarcus sp.]